MAKHQIVRVLLPFVTGLLFFAGCSQQDNLVEQQRTVVSKSPQSQRELHWMGHWQSEHDREILVRDVAKEFELLNPHIKLDLKSTSEIIGTRSKVDAAQFIANMIKTGKIDWDVVWMDDHIYLLVASELNDPEWGKKHLVDFENVPGFKETQKSFIFKDPRYRNQTGGIIVGPHLEGYFIVLWYNKFWTDKIGIKIKPQDMTFDDFLGYVKAIYEYNQNNNTNIAPIYEASDWYTMGNYLLQSLVKSEISDFDKIKANIGSPQKNAALLKALKAFEELGKYAPLIDSMDQNKWFVTRDLILDDKAVFYINGIWMYSHWSGIDEARGEHKMSKMMPAELPVFQKADHYIGGFIPTWAVLRDSPHKEDAIKLMLFWSRPQVAEKWVRYTKAPTAVKGSFSTSSEGTDIYEDFQAKIVDKYETNLHDTADVGYILGDQNKLVTRDLFDGCIRILKGRATAQEVYDSIMIKVE